MAGNSFGQAFRITTAGESHGPANVVIIDGVPPGIELSVDDLMVDLNRRRPGQSKIVTQRDEGGRSRKFLSGVFEGRTTGTSLAILIRNNDQRSRDYEDIKHVYRPGHADYTYDAKYGFRDYRGGGRSSARETTVRVAAGVVAKKLIHAAFGGQVVGYVKQVGDVVADVPDPAAITLEQVEKLPDGEPNIVRCPDPHAAARMVSLIESLRGQGDSIGGAAEIVATGVPAGAWRAGLRQNQSRPGQGALQPAGGARRRVRHWLRLRHAARQSEQRPLPPCRPTDESRAAGHHHGNQPPRRHARRHHQWTAAGAARGGQTDQQPADRTADRRRTRASRRRFAPKGRHDPCLLPRFVPMAEAMVAIVLADHWLRWKAQICGADRVSWQQRDLTLKPRRRGLHIITEEVVSALAEL